MAGRCDFSDLPVDQCSHCRKDAAPEQQERAELAKLLRRPGWFAALYRGQCPACSEWYGPGFPIHWDATKRWIGGCCADTLTPKETS